MQIDGFDWDDGNLAKCQIHGVTVVSIETALRNEPLIAPDVAHSVNEQRWIAIGRGESQRSMFVAFTLRIREGLSLARPVSARFMHAKEMKRYEQSATKSPGNDK